MLRVTRVPVHRDDASTEMGSGGLAGRQLPGAMVGHFDGLLVVAVALGEWRGYKGRNT